MSTITRPLGPPADATDDGDAMRSRGLYRTMWRWHFYAGLLVIPVIVLLCLSGIVYLFKPQIYGLMYGKMQTVTPAERTVSYQQQRANGVYDGAKSTTVGEKLPNGQSPWALGNLPLAASDTSHREHTAGGELRWDPHDGAPLDAVVSSAQQLGVPHGFTITLPEDATGSYLIAYWEDGDMEPNRSATDMRVAYIDQYTAKPLADYNFGDLGPAAQATNVGIALHEGRQWGLVSQLMALAGAVAILVSVASAMVMWRKRRPKGLGPPRKEPHRKLGFGVLIIMIALGALFPLLGLSMLAILALEFFVIRRVPLLARMFGTEAA